jgi:hypothetical protein
MLGSLDMWQGVPVADAEPSHKEGPVAQSLILHGGRRFALHSQIASETGQPHCRPFSTGAVSDGEK